MNLSDLFGGADRGAIRADYVVISGEVTDSVITSSPAIIIGVTPGGLQTGGSAGNQYYYSYQIFDGSSIVAAGVGYPAYSFPVLGNTYCPNGIKVTVAGLPNYGPVTLTRLTISYVLV